MVDYQKRLANDGYSLHAFLIWNEMIVSQPFR